MAKVLDAITDDLAAWIRRQHIFFVATAPLTGDGLINCSPKGLDTLALLDGQRVAYLDLTGSGAETIAHVRENGRIVLLFCAFEGPPQITRLHGTGRVVAPTDAEYPALRAHFPPMSGDRAIIVVEATRISTSCGYGVPLYAYEGERTQIPAFVEAKGPAGIAAYQKKNNLTSLDGLPALHEHEITG